ncbi:BTAD domain-containing putative transcriptional regulator [Actinoallomurus sp. NPDC050550]|uniref:BTAD domain-containing putative transcriptional regulator n=1 Tax=Actinoallomurus sp. NPDC050550 TaxID=3154937 RepID=UPI0033EAC32E
MSDHVRFGLLGPLEAWSRDVRLDLGPPKRRVLLTRLLIEGGHTVSADRLCDDLWEGSPPSGAVSSIHSHISRLRAVLEPERSRRGQGTLLVSGPTGYTLNAPSDTRDSTRFEEAVNRARELLARGRLSEARREVESGLSLWRGVALADAANYAFAAREISRLDEIRMAGGELNAAILLEQGEHDKAALMAEELTTRSPLREAAWALLMRALYLAGRPAEALRRYETIRTLLAEELGTVPSPELSSVHLAILRQDLPALAPVGSPASPASPGEPAALAARPSGATRLLVGRTQELARYDELLDDAAEGNTRWVVLSGEAGIGKTRLAEEFASRAADATFRVVWVRCGSDVPSEEGDDRFHPLAQLLSALDPQIRMEGEPDAIARKLAERLARQPTICLIEDLHRADHGFRRLLGMYATLMRDVPLVVVCTTQDTDDVGLRELLALLVRQSRATFLPLNPLTVEDVHELMMRHSIPFAPGLPDGELSRREAEALHRRGEGNPFLITEILELPGDKRTGSGAQLPESVIRVLRARLDLLDERVLRMLESMATIGGELDPGLLVQVRAITREELLSLIDAAVIARVLNWEENPSGGQGRYLMPDLAREMVLHDLTPARRQMLHAATARALGELRHRHPAQIARHLMAAGPLVPSEELVEAAMRAGNRCAEDDQHAEAAHWFDHASALADDPGVRAEAEHAAREARRRLDQTRQA